jgi:hypothetical protein
MDFAGPVASRIAGETTDSFTTGITFATWTFNKAKFASFGPRGNRNRGSDSDAAVAHGYREEHLPSAVGEGLLP